MVGRFATRGVITGAAALLLAVAATADAQTAAAAQTPATASPRALLDKYCVTCHSDRLRTGGLTLQAADVSAVPAGADLWEKVIRKLRTGSMPPAGAPRPGAAALAAVASHLETEIDRAAAAHPNPGRTESLHRLNRAEYQNAIRDLLGLSVDAAALVPADDQSYGFDNIAGVLKMSPTLLERYMGAAREISRLAVGASPVPATAETFRLRSDLSQYERVDGLPFGTRGGAAVTFNFPRDGEYVLKVAMLDLFGGGQIKEPHQLEVSLDGARVAVFMLRPKGSGGSATYDTAASLEARAVVKAGPRQVSATFIKKTSALAESVRQPFSRPHGEGDFLLYQPHIGTVTISGPFNATGPGDTPSRRTIFTCRPATEAEEGPCARRIVSALARRAYRRPVTDADVNPLIGFYTNARARWGFEAGVEKALQAILVSPSFLYRVETDPARAAADVYRIGDIELASRLSFFLWSSIPDDELLGAAERGRLGDRAELDRQVRRMLKDPRAGALATNFAAQWLRLRNVSGATPDDVIFPNFSENLRNDVVQETVLFIQSIINENRSLVDLLTGDFTYVNERLAKFYGIPNIYGGEFRRVPVSSDARRGLLGHASILTVTSYSDRTSPVGRGKWILENVLGTPPPPPPPNVPALKENGATGKSMRERMTAHRANPVCASCHSRMDPLGFALENFDAIGRWRGRAEDGQRIDASGALPDGTKFDGPSQLRALLIRNPEQFVTVVMEKMLIYALGRGIEHYDAPAVRQLVRGAAADGYRVSDLVVGLVSSTPFQMRRRSPPAAVGQPVAALVR